MTKQSMLTRVVVKASDRIYKAQKSIQKKNEKQPPFMTEKPGGRK